MPFQSPNYTQVPNDLFDDMLPLMGYAELKITLTAIRLTIGYHVERQRISLTNMMKLTGLSRHGVIDGAVDAEKRGTLERQYTESGEIEWVVKLVHQGSEASAPKVVKLVHRPSYSKKRKESNFANAKENDTPQFNGIGYGYSE